MTKTQQLTHDALRDAAVNGNGGDYAGMPDWGIGSYKGKTPDADFVCGPMLWVGAVNREMVEPELLDQKIQPPEDSVNFADVVTSPAEAVEILSELLESGEYDHIKVYRDDDDITDEITALLQEPAAA